MVKSDAINLFLFANSSVMSSIKKNSEEEYKNIVVYGTSRSEQLADTFVMCLSKRRYKAFIIIDDDCFTENDISNVCTCLQQALHIVNFKIKVFLITGDNRKIELTKTMLSSYIDNQSINLKYYEASTIDSVILKNIYYDVLGDSSSYEKTPEVLNVKDRAVSSTPINTTYEEVVNISTNDYEAKDIRFVSLLGNVDSALKSAVTQLDKVSKSSESYKVIEEHLNSETFNPKEVFEDLSNTDEVSKNVKNSTLLIEKEIQNITTAIEKDSSNTVLLNQLKKLTAYKDKAEVMHNEYLFKLFTNTLNKVLTDFDTEISDSMSGIKEQSDKIVTLVNTGQYKENIKELKKQKDEMKQALNTYIERCNKLNSSLNMQIPLIHNYTSKVSNEQCSQIIETLNSIPKDSSQHTAISNIYKTSMPQVKSLMDTPKILKQLHTQTSENLISLLQQSSTISNALNTINNVLETVVTEQDNYIDVLETQKTVKNVVVENQLAEKLIVISGTSGVGKTVTALSSAHALSDIRKVAVVDLSLNSAKSHYYVSSIENKMSLADFIQRGVPILSEQLQSSNNYFVVYNDANIITLEMMYEQADIYKELTSKFDLLCKYFHYVFVIVDSVEYDISKYVINNAGRLVFVTNTDIDCNIELAQMVEQFEQADNLKLPTIKFLIVTQFSSSFENFDELLNTCNIDARQYRVLTIPTVNVNICKYKHVLPTMFSELLVAPFDIWRNILIDL